MLAGYDEDLAARSTRLTNRLHDALLHVHPALERLLGRHFSRPGVLRLLAAAPAPRSAIARLGRSRDRRALADGSPRLAPDPGRQDPAASRRADRHHPGHRAYGQVIPGSPASCSRSGTRETLTADLEELLDDPPPRRGPDLDARRRPRTAIELLPPSVTAPASPAPPTWPPTPAWPRRPDSPAPRSRETPVPPREPGPQGRPVPVGFRQPAAPGQPGLLRPQTSRGQEPHRPR